MFDLFWPTELFPVARFCENHHEYLYRLGRQLIVADARGI